MIEIPQNQFKELIFVCEETKTPYEIDNSYLFFNFITIGKICFSCDKESGQILYSFKERINDEKKISKET